MYFTSGLKKREMLNDNTLDCKCACLIFIPQCNIRVSKNSETTLAYKMYVVTAY